MDSSRSGLLSTLIMTVPLIVVPAIALLRPATSGPGLVSEDLQGAAEDDFFNEQFGEFPGNEFDKQSSNAQKRSSQTGSEDFSDWFTEEDQTKQETEASSTRNGQLNSMVDPFDQSTPDLSGNPDLSGDPDLAGNTVRPQEPADPSLSSANSSGAPSASTRTAAQPEPQETELLRQLKSAGAARTMWFSPGTTGQAGFVAFIPIAQTSTQYRFEATGASRSEAVRNVLRQVLQWQSEKNLGRQ